MGISFSHPGWLWALAAIVPLCVIALTGFTSMSRWRRLSAAFARALLTVLIVAMLAGAQRVRETDRLAVIGVVDLSGSVQRFGRFEAGEAASDFARRYFADRTEQRGPEDLFGLVVFDGRSTTIATPTRSRTLDRSMSMLPIDGSDLAGALRHAAALVPADAAGRIVLLSDGNATGEDPVAAAALLGADRDWDGASSDRNAPVPIDVVPIEYRVDAEVIVEQVDAPPAAVAGSTVPLRVTLRSTGPASGTLRVLREGEPVDLGGPGGGRRVLLDAGRRVEILEVPLEEGRLSRFEAIFEPDVDEAGEIRGDRSLENNRADAFTISPGESRVLLVDGVDNGTPGGPGSVLAESLRRDGLGVEVVAPAGMPRDLLSLQAHDLVILQNVSADEMPRESMDAMVAFVRELGGGLVVVGGPDTLGPGGWRGSALEPILPVQLFIPEKLVVPEAAIVIVLDNSGSMQRGVLGSSRTQQEVANESAARAIESLDPGDLVGVVAFNNTPNIVVPIGKIGREGQKGSISERTRAISSGGGTNLPPAMRIAREQLMTVEAKHKHIIVLSDGQSQGAEQLEALAGSIRDDGIRVSAIAVGDGADLQTLEAISRRGDGAFYHVLNPSVLPNVFLKAVRIVRSPLIREQPFEPVVLDTDSALASGMDQPPRLGGLVLTQARTEPTITYAMATPAGEPVLAHWPVELGQVAVFTSDAHDWASRWLEWPGYTPFWARIARLMSRTTGGETGELRVSRDGGRLAINYDATDKAGNPIDLLTVPATVFGPTGEPVRINLDQTGPGRYSARVPATGGGNYLVIAKPAIGTTPLPPLLSGVTISRGEEYSRLATDRATLARIAEASGGRLLGSDDRADLFERASIPPRRTRTPLWPTLLVWTLVVFLLDVGTRRIAWDRLLPERGGERDLQRIAAGAAERVATLRGTRGPAVRATEVQALSDADAERLRRESRQNRYRAHIEELQRLQKNQAANAQRNEPASPASPAKPAAPTKPPADAADEPTGLLAAKRRARERFEDRGDG